MNWFQMWREDRESMMDTMIRNMVSDLENGYNYFGNCIQRQKAEIDRFKQEYEADLDRLGEMDEKKANRWCYVRLIKLGAIA